MEEQQPQPQKNNLLVPIAIVVAGALVAVAVYLTNSGVATPGTGANSSSGQTTATQGSVPKSVTDITISPITSADHQLGSPNAPLAIVVYTDPECPFCKEFHATMQQVMNTYGKDGELLWVYRDFPIAQLHPKAPNESDATECAAALGGQTAYWAYFTKLFSITPSNNGLDPSELPTIATDVGLNLQKFNACLSANTYASKVQKEYNEAVNSGGRGTPYSVFVMKKPLTDAQVSAINDISTTNNFPPGTFAFSPDKLRMSMSGALPYSIMQQILNTLLGKSAG